jgi:hypothetical protein
MSLMYVWNIVYESVITEMATVYILDFISAKYEYDVDKICSSMVSSSSATMLMII